MDTDILIIGTGPAGLQAAIHAAKRKASTLVIGKDSGSALASAKIENYFGIAGVTAGADMLAAGLEQARAAGAEVVRQNATAARQEDGGFIVTLESGTEVRARAVILATGITRRKLNVPGETDFLGRGVSYCATCDCNFHRDVPVVVVGDESEAAISAELMTKYASSVHWITDAPDVDDMLMEKAVSAGVEVLDTRLTAIIGSDSVSSVQLADGREIAANGVFIELGGKSSADLAMDLGILPEIDDTVKVSETCATEVAGVFACGDVTGKPWQLAKAVGQGAVAGLSAAEHVRVDR
jgi:thioredoxin reductase (NADPH)